MGAGGYWDEFGLALETQKSLLASLIEEQPTSLIQTATIRLFICVFFFPYFQDLPQENIQIRRQLAQLAQLNVENYAKEQVEKCRQNRSPILKIDPPSKRLKIGYLSHAYAAILWGGWPAGCLSTAIEIALK